MASSTSFMTWRWIEGPRLRRDRLNERIQVFDESGGFLKQWPGLARLGTLLCRQGGSDL